jgi:hypothetical protein
MTGLWRSPALVYSFADPYRVGNEQGHYMPAENEKQTESAEDPRAGRSPTLKTDVEGP